MAHADGRTYWVAVVRDAPREGGGLRLMPAPTPAAKPAAAEARQTVVRARAVGASESQWQQVALLSQPAAGLTGRDGALAVLLADGQWLTVFDGGSGRFPTPGDQAAAGAETVGRLVALAQGRDALFGIVDPLGALPATRPATAPASAPATLPAGPRRFALWTYRDGAWAESGPLPAAVDPVRVTHLSAVASGDGLYLAAGTTGGNVELFRWTRAADPATKNAATSPATRRAALTGRWAEIGRVAADPAEPFALLLDADPALPALWSGAGGGPGTLWPLQPTGEGQTASSTGLRVGPAVALPRGTPPPDAAGRPRTAVIAGRTLRVLYASADGELYEQDFKPDGSAELRSAKALATPAAGPSPVGRSFNLLILSLLLLVSIFGFRRRPVPQEVLDRLDVPLAPLGLRAAAGLVDLVPMLAAFAVVYARHPEVAAGTATATDLDVLILVASLIAYVGHTTAGEWWAGRSVGKLLFRLRVARTDGEPMNGAAAVSRNAMRMVDVALSFVPLLWILLNPLRQRLGDLVAGTVVVLNAAVTPVGPTDEARRRLEEKEPAGVE